MCLKSISDLALSGWFFILNKYQSADFLNKHMLNNIDSLKGESILDSPLREGGHFTEKIIRKTQITFLKKCCKKIPFYRKLPDCTFVL